MTATEEPSPYCCDANASMYCHTPSGTTSMTWARPPVKNHTWLNTLPSHITDRTVKRTKIGLTIGMVTCLNATAGEAPSTAAASARSSGTSVNAEYMVRATKGTACQTIIAVITP